MEKSAHSSSSQCHSCVCRVPEFSYSVFLAQQRPPSIRVDSHLVRDDIHGSNGFIRIKSNCAVNHVAGTTRSLPEISGNLRTSFRCSHVGVHDLRCLRNASRRITCCLRQLWTVTYVC